MTFSDSPAQCIGGPFNGRKLPGGVVSWLVWLPRRPGEPAKGPLSPQQVFSRPHYRYAGMRRGRRLYRWEMPKRAGRDG